MFDVIVANRWRDDIKGEDEFTYYRHIMAWLTEWKTWLYENNIRHFGYESNLNDGGCSTIFHFKNEDDATAFKLRWI